MTERKPCAETVEEIVAACESMAGLPYDGEPVDQLEHALQCAALAREQGDREFVVAALLHDIARAPAVAGIPYDGPQEHHGAAAARWLTPRVGTRVAWLAEQHIAAKRYLVATDPGYEAKLTEVSARTLKAQGGPMNAAEIDTFQAHPDCRLALQLREIDDLGKVPGAQVPELDDYCEDLRDVVAEHVQAAPRPSGDQACRHRPRPGAGGGGSAAGDGGTPDRLRRAG